MPSINPVLAAYITGSQQKRQREQMEFQQQQQTEAAALRQKQFEQEQKEFEKRLTLEQKRVDLEDQARQAQLALTHHQIQQAIRMGAAQGLYPAEAEQLQRQQEIPNVQFPEQQMPPSPSGESAMPVPATNARPGVTIEGEHFTNLPSPESVAAAKRVTMRPEIEAKIEEAKGITEAQFPFKKALAEQKSIFDMIRDQQKYQSNKEIATIKAGATTGAAQTRAAATRYAADVRRMAQGGNPADDQELINHINSGNLPVDLIPTKTKDRLLPKLQGVYTRAESDNLAKFGGTIAALNQIEEVTKEIQQKYPLQSSGILGSAGLERSAIVRIKNNDLYKRLQSINLKMPELGRTLGVNRWSVPEQKIFEKGVTRLENSDQENFKRVDDLKALLQQKMKEAAPNASDQQVAAMVARHTPKSESTGQEKYIIHNGEKIKVRSTDGGITWHEVK